MSSCTRTDAHAVGECANFDPDAIAQKAFKLLVDDRITFGQWDDGLWAEWIARENEVPESEMRLMDGNR